MLKYDYQYDIAAFVITVILIGIIKLRKSYRTRSTNIFVILLESILLASFFDAISCYTITYPNEVPLWLNYLVSLGYLFLYNECSVLFLLYIDSRAKIGKIRNLVDGMGAAITLFYAITIFLSPFTHWIAYFDESLEYRHGPLFLALYFFAFGTFLAEFVLFAVARKNFNRYQIYTSVALILSVGVSVIASMISPRLLIGHMFMAISMVFVYIAYENPAHYMYKETTCLNRRAFTEMIRRRKIDNWSFGFVEFTILDYDYIRHNHGIDVMDKATSMIAEFLSRTFKSNAYVLADDKYAILVFSKAGIEKAKQLIREFFVMPFEVENDEFRMNVSFIEFEWVDLSLDVDEIESLVGYNMTHSDKEVIEIEEVYTIIEKKQRREQILHAIKNAIDNDGFEVYYQPICERESGKFHSAEALIRLIDPELGFINPEELITLAEESGYINKIGEMVFRKVCAFMRDCKVQELGISYIEVNLSPRQCMEPSLAAVFQNIMSVYNIEPGWINLEITETAQTSDNSYWRRNVERLRRLGVEFSIDDYGSGFASAEYLIRFPISIVKIDKSILWSAMKDEAAMVVLTNTIRMLKELGKKIVVEGVEDEDMIKVLDDNGVDYHQGYYYSKPLPPEDFLNFLREKTKKEEKE